MILLASKNVPRIHDQSIFVSCTIFVPGFVIKSTGFTLVPAFFVTNLFNLEASFIHKFRMSLSPPQSVSEYASSSPLCCPWKRHSARGFSNFLSVEWVTDPFVLVHAYSDLPVAMLAAMLSCVVW